MTVDILPLELNFARPFTVEVARTLTIRNTGSTPLAFKVKTTAPKQYCVRPNAGRIEPGNSFDVTVLLQAMKQNPPADAKCRDKFLVQCAPISSEQDFASIATVLESVDKTQLTERKIRVNWTGGESSPGVSTPTKSSAAAAGVNDTPDGTTRTFSSPSGHAHSLSTPHSAPPPYTSDDGADEIDEKPRPSAVSQAAAAVTETAQLTYEELKTKLSQAEAQLIGLKDSGLRQRNVKTTSGDDKKPAGTAQAVKHQAEGVSVQIVAVLCLLSFLLAYFFF